MRIQEIISSKENQSFDCKSIQIDPKTLAIPIVAFANADGGVIVIDVSDKIWREGGVDQYAEKLNELLRVPLDFCNSSVPIISDLLPCTDRDGNENHILLVCLPASSELHPSPQQETKYREEYLFRIFLSLILFQSCCHCCHALFAYNLFIITTL